MGGAVGKEHRVLLRFTWASYLRVQNAFDWGHQGLRGSRLIDKLHIVAGFKCMAFHFIGFYINLL